MGKSLSSDSTPHLSILIPTRDNENDLMDCLGSIVNLDWDLEKAEIMIWDNASRTEGKARIKRYLSELKESRLENAQLIEANGNYGVYTSRDKLFKRVKPDSEYILSIDDDVILPSSLLRELISLFEQDQKIGIIGPRTVYDDEPAVTAHGAGFVNMWLGQYSTKDARKPLECDYVIGCCMLIRKSVIDEIGGFDPDYFTSHGEVDFCLRAKKKGYKIIYYPGVSVRHRVARGGTRTPERIYYVYRNKLFVIKKNASLAQKCFSLGLYSLFWFPKAIIDSFVHHKRFDSREINTILNAAIDGWLNRGGRRAQSGSDIG
jgi:GT2 family glycosyltransferase